MSKKLLKEMVAFSESKEHYGGKFAGSTGEGLLKDVMFISFLLTTSSFVSELLVGITSNSLAIISDAFHASIDLITALLLAVAGRVAIRPPDENHTYGHGKVDILGGFLGAMVLFSMAIYILYEATIRWMEGQYTLSAGPLSYAVLGYVLLTEILRARILSPKRDKEVVRVGLVHNLSDAGGTIVAIFGSFLASNGFLQADLLASVALSCLIIFASVKMMRSLGLELSDAISKKDVVALRALLVQIKECEGFKDIRMRKVGYTYYAEVTILMKPDTSIEDAHRVSEKIEEAVKNKFGITSVCTIHIEPSFEESAIKQYVAEEVKDIKGLKDIHHVRFGLVGGVMHFTLHARVDGNITLEEAHEISDEIELRLNRKFKNVRTFVHLEPYAKGLTKAESIKPSLEVLQELIGNVAGVKEIDSIDVYELGGKSFFEICIKADREMPLEAAHEMASEIEALVRSKVGTNVSIEVHVEPF